jgi:type VI secretion system protein ImpK
MLLGFGGRYSAGNRGELSQVLNMTAEKIRRIRGRMGPLSPSWALPDEKPRSGSDPLVRKLSILAIACASLMVLLFVIYKIVLGSGVHV